MVDVGDAFVVPGLIDLHNHIGYNTLPLWTEPTAEDAVRPSRQLDQCPELSTSISWPSKALAAAAPEALLAHVQLRALVGGTTAIQGWPTANREHVQVLRNIDDETAGGTEPDLIYTSTLTMKPLDLAKMAQAQKNGAGFIYHCAEGQVGSLVAARVRRLCQRRLPGQDLHRHPLQSLSRPDWQRWAKATPAPSSGRRSPTSGCTGRPPTSRLPDSRASRSASAPTGGRPAPRMSRASSRSRSSRARSSGSVSPIATRGHGHHQPGRRAVALLEEDDRPPVEAPSPTSPCSGRRAKPVWTQIVESTEADIALVVVDGVPRYGDPALMQATGGPTAKFRLAGKDRRFAIATRSSRPRPGLGTKSPGF